MRGKNLSSAHPIAICDWHSTFLTLAGAANGAVGAHGAHGEDGGAPAAQASRGLPLPRMDGVDQWPVISGQSTGVMRVEVFVGSGVLIQANYKLIATDTAQLEGRWSGPLYPKVPATGNALACTQAVPCLFDVVTDYREEHDLASTQPEVVARLQARLAELMQGVFEADPVPNATQAKVCTASVANGMWITPCDWPSLPPVPPSPGPPPPPPPPLAGDRWLAFLPQWRVNHPPPSGGGATITAEQNRAVLKKACAPSTSLPANETRFFDAGQVVALAAPPTLTDTCGLLRSYYEVEARLP